MTPITLNLDPSLVKFIKTFAKENWITQKEVVEMSLKEKRKIKLGYLTGNRFTITLRDLDKKDAMKLSSHLRKLDYFSNYFGKQML